jgi:hypothetical protein
MTRLEQHYAALNLCPRTDVIPARDALICRAMGRLLHSGQFILDQVVNILECERLTPAACPSGGTA